MVPKPLKEVIKPAVLDRAERLASDDTASTAAQDTAAELVRTAAQYKTAYEKARSGKALGEPSVSSTLNGVAAKLDELAYVFDWNANRGEPQYKHDWEAGPARTVDGPVDYATDAVAPMHPWSRAISNVLQGKSVRDLGSFSVPVPASALLDTKAFPADSIAGVDDDERPHEMPRRGRFVADLLARRPVDDGTLSYLRQTVRTNNAAPVARHGTKPTSIYGIERIEDRPRTIAHLSEAIAVQDIADNVGLDTFIRQELVDGVRKGLDAQIVNGDGTGEAMTGLFPAITEVSAFAVDAATSARKALTLLESRDVSPTAFLMAPGDWEALELASIANSQHLSQAPVDRAAQRLWSVPVVLSTAGRWPPLSNPYKPHGFFGLEDPPPRVTAPLTNGGVRLVPGGPQTACVA